MRCSTLCARSALLRTPRIRPRQSKEEANPDTGHCCRRAAHVQWEQIHDSSKTEAKAIVPVYTTNLRLERGQSKSTIQANPRRASLKVAQAIETDGSKTQKLAGKPDRGVEYRTRWLAPLRQEPRYRAPKTQDIDTGATISVLETKGD